MGLEVPRCGHWGPPEVHLLDGLRSLPGEESTKGKGVKEDRLSPVLTVAVRKGLLGPRRAQAQPVASVIWGRDSIVSKGHEMSLLWPLTATLQLRGLWALECGGRPQHGMGGRPVLGRD